jgi:hypothetical protein
LVFFVDDAMLNYIEEFLAKPNEFQELALGQRRANHIGQFVHARGQPQPGSIRPEVLAGHHPAG